MTEMDIITVTIDYLSHIDLTTSKLAMSGRSLSPGRFLAEMSLVVPHFPLMLSSSLPLSTVPDSRLSSCWVLRPTLYF